MCFWVTGQTDPYSTDTLIDIWPKGSGIAEMQVSCRMSGAKQDVLETGGSGCKSKV